MILNIIQGIFNIIILAFCIKISIDGYKDSESQLEKVLYVILVFAVFFPILLFYLDRCNIPTKIGWMENIASSDWINSLMTYSATLCSTLISAVILIFVTFKQLDETNRIQNLPFLQYNFINEISSEEMFGENQEVIFSNQKDSSSDALYFTMEIENIGLNTVRKVYLELESSLFNGKEYFKLCNQSNIEKGDKKKKSFMITNVEKGIYKIEMFVYYQDLLKNWYKQKINLTISLTNLYNSKSNNCIQISSVEVYDEEELLREPSFIKMI